MAERRMFAKTIVTSDDFLDMPMSARCLYFTLGMFADDDGFVNSPKSIMRQVGSSNDDMNILIAKKYLLVFENGVIVIKHWRIHNYIQKDRYIETKYVEQKRTLWLDENKAYTTNESSAKYNVYGKELDNTRSVYILDTQEKKELELGKDSVGQDNSKKERNSYKQIINEYTTDEETEKAIFEFIQFYQAKQKVCILNDQLRTFLDNLSNMGLLFAENVRGCIANNNLQLAFIENYYELQTDDL
jgi:hypothetical protein